MGLKKIIQRWIEQKKRQRIKKKCGYKNPIDD